MITSKFSSNLNQSLIVSVCYFGHLLMGFGFGWSAPILKKLKDPKETPLSEVVSDQQAALSVSFYMIALLIGPHTTTYLSNLAGRKPCLLLGGVIAVISFLILALANNLAMIYSGRFLCSFGLSILFVIHLVYIGEIASTSVRGIFLSALGIFTNLGILLAYCVGPYLSYHEMSYFGIAMTLIYIGGVLMIPETPLFLAMKGKEQKLKKSLEILKRSEEYDSIILMKNNMDAKEHAKDKWTDIITIKSNRKALFIVLSLLLFQQISGILVLLSFVTTIFELAKSSISSHMSTILVGLSQVAAGGIAPLFIEKIGRIPILLCSTAICFICMGLLAIYFYLTEIQSPITDSIDWLPLVSLVTFSMSYALGFGSIPSTLVGEMFTPSTRTSGASITITLSWFLGFVMTTAFGYLLPLGTHVSFWIFTVGCACAFSFSLIFVPETKGKSLLEVQEMLNR